MLYASRFCTLLLSLATPRNYSDECDDNVGIIQCLTSGAADTGEGAHAGVEAGNDVLHDGDLARVLEAGVHLGEEPGGGGVVDVEHDRGVADGGGALVTETLDGHHVVQTHLLHNQVIKQNKTVTWKKGNM